MTYTEGWPKRLIARAEGALYEVTGLRDGRRYHFDQQIVPLSDAERLRVERDAAIRERAEVMDAGVKASERAERLREDLRRAVRSGNEVLEERDRLRTEAAQWEGNFNGMVEVERRLKGEVERLREELGRCEARQADYRADYLRLREALERAAEYDCYTDGGCGPNFKCASCIARAALDGLSEGPRAPSPLSGGGIPARRDVVPLAESERTPTNWERLNAIDPERGE